MFKDWVRIQFRVSFGFGGAIELSLGFEFGLG